MQPLSINVGSQFHGRSFKFQLAQMKRDGARPSSLSMHSHHHSSGNIALAYGGQQKHAFVSARQHERTSCQKRTQYRMVSELAAVLRRVFRQKKAKFCDDLSEACHPLSESHK